ncbi:MAG TPA: hypothetical protein VFI59_03420 [Actinomycetota bacterium]|nr:hypothetical protein [Actinomycetota bacterium]
MTRSRRAGVGDTCLIEHQAVARPHVGVGGELQDVSDVRAGEHHPSRTNH